MDTDAKPVLLILADISGYTKFMVSHEKELRHSQVIVGELLESLIRLVDVPLQVSGIEGDALFLYARKTSDGEIWRRHSSDLMGRLLAFFRVFEERLLEIGAFSVCRCDACSRVGNLKLKVIVHSGHAIFTKVGDFPTLSGVDVITLHRLAKNSVDEDSYVLLTESAYDDLELPEGLSIREGSEEYDTGVVKTFVFDPGVVVEFDEERIRAAFSDDNAGVRILRDEIEREYVAVATEPERGYHFNVGRAALATIGYEEELLAGIPASAVDAFAGMGNPFALGLPAEGEYVVDVGSGAGLDAIIAARAVGEAGYVIGVDMTPAMLARAEAARAELDLSQLEFRRGFAETIPVPDGWADLIISNGVANLAPDKGRVFSEMFRVLHPGGRLQIADLSVQHPIPEEAKKDIELWAA